MTLEETFEKIDKALSLDEEVPDNAITKERMAEYLKKKGSSFGNTVVGCHMRKLIEENGWTEHRIQHGQKRIRYILPPS